MAQQAMGAMPMGRDSLACPFRTAATSAMGGEMAGDPQMRLTALRPGTAADSARALAFIEDVRRLLAKYQDVQAAAVDGYRQWLPTFKLPFYHFTSWHRAIEALVRFDPARPTSLLYRQESDGHFRLIGAMYTAPASLADDSLNALIPLSLARWHAHVNWCVPPPGAGNRWPETRSGGPIAGISTRAGCDSVGGTFRPRIYDWSIHVYAFAGDDPRAVWCVDNQEMEAMEGQ
jgi:hypothetical protein